LRSAEDAYEKDKKLRYEKAQREREEEEEKRRARNLAKEKRVVMTPSASAANEENILSEFLAEVRSVDDPVEAPKSVGNNAGVSKANDKKVIGK